MLANIILLDQLTLFACIFPLILYFVILCSPVIADSCYMNVKPPGFSSLIYYLGVYYCCLVDLKVSLAVNRQVLLMFPAIRLTVNYCHCMACIFIFTCNKERCVIL